jgi:asparagine synthase (glutamine-hydrolysing)
MAHSVEARMPFLDRKVIETAAVLPPFLKMYGLKEKYVLKKAFKNIVPDHVARRRKFGYRAPLEWLWNRQSDLIETYLSEESIQRTGLFSYERLKLIRNELSDPKLTQTRRQLVLQGLHSVLSSQHLVYYLRNIAESSRLTESMTTVETHV